MLGVRVPPGLPFHIRKSERFKVRKVLDFLKEARAELRKVVWPTRKETISSTYLVIVMVIIVSAFLGLVDSVLAWLVKEILSL